MVAANKITPLYPLNPSVSVKQLIDLSMLQPFQPSISSIEDLRPFELTMHLEAHIEKQRMSRIRHVGLSVEL